MESFLELPIRHSLLNQSLSILRVIWLVRRLLFHSHYSSLILPLSSIHLYHYPKPFILILSYHHWRHSCLFYWIRRVASWSLSEFRFWSYIWISFSIHHNSECDYQSRESSQWSIIQSLFHYSYSTNSVPLFSGGILHSHQQTILYHSWMRWRLSPILSWRGISPFWSLIRFIFRSDWRISYQLNSSFH